MKHTSTVLVTGAAGFIGSHVCDELLKKGYRVVGLDDLSGGFRENVSKAVIFKKGSITDVKLVPRLFKQYRFEHVFHLAAYAAEGLSHFIRRYNYNLNLLGTVTLINAAVNSGTVKCFVFASSIAVYGRNQLPMTEETVPMPEDPYGISKYAVELDLKAAHEMFGLNYVIFRPHNVFGERQNLADPYRNVAGIFMNQVMQGKKLTIFGDGSQTRAFSHISCVAPILVASIERQQCWNQVFNVGADKPYSVLELAKTVSRVMGAKENFRFLPARYEVVHAWSSHEKVRKHFGDIVRDVDLETGVRRSVEWARGVGPRKGIRFSGIEVEKNMPEFWKKLT